MIINSLHGDTGEQATILGVEAAVPAPGLLCPLRDYCSRWWFNFFRRRSTQGHSGWCFNLSVRSPVLSG